MNKTLSAALGIVVLLSACVGPFKSRGKWPTEEFDRVVGYQFVNPPGIGSPFLTVQNKLDLSSLPRLKRKVANLDPNAVHELLSAVSSDEPSPKVFLSCYDPHHIFIFYRGEKPVAAFEVCFICQNGGAWPEYPPGTTSFKKLAMLCIKLGLDTDAPPDQEEITERYHREHRFDEE